MGFTGLCNVPRGKSKVKSATASFYVAENNKLNGGYKCRPAVQSLGQLWLSVN